EGFAMFHSRVSSFNIVDATPFHRDPLQELAEACARHGLRLGFYYSQAQDWHHPGGAARTPGQPMAGGDPAGGHWDPAQDGDFDDYLDRIAAPQVRELLTNYGHISILWWDSPVGMTPARAARMAELLKLQPHLITNNRLLNPRVPNAFSGDTETPEQFIPATGFENRLFEVCMTMNETWGYKAHDQHWKPAADITRKLIDIASKGGNFLLNVGPDAQGEIPAPSVERLRESGRWVRAHGEAIYGTSASLFRRLPWGRSTTKGNTIYLHVFDWPAEGRLFVPGLKSPVARAIVVGDRAARPLDVEMTNEGAVVHVPDEAPHPVASVLKLEFAAPPVVDQPLPAPDANGIVLLPANLAAIVNAYDGNAQLFGAGERAVIGDWNRGGTMLHWEFRTIAAGRFVIEAEMSSRSGGVLSVTVDQETVTTRAEPSAGAALTWQRLGEIEIRASGEHALEVKSGQDDWSESRLRAVRLRALR
ncbi:MAG TPA: alpha-L-fucosidase, partial [Opitutus sp.]|nr:alpha-L-fucosidase [Opitutus sp.]